MRPIRAVGAFDWDDANKAHLKRHAVTPEEAEQVYTNQPFEMEHTVVGQETRTLHLGETDTGRVLFSVTTPWAAKIRPVTAWDAGRARPLYARLKENDHE